MIELVVYLPLLEHEHLEVLNLGEGVLRQSLPHQLVQELLLFVAGELQDGLVLRSGLLQVLELPVELLQTLRKIEYFTGVVFDESVQLAL